jgi:large repetitive protein
MRRSRNLAGAVVAALIVLGFASSAAALAAPPTLEIKEPAQGSFTNNQTPTFSGSTNDELDSVTLAIYEGATATGTPVQTATTPLPPTGGAWTLSPGTPLNPGQYTAVAEQTAGTETGKSAPVTFTVKTAAPAVTIDPVVSPTNNPTPKLEGKAGTAEGDEPSVTVTIYQGESTSGTEVAKEGVTVTSGTWEYTPPHLADGTYTAQATQKDKAGNTGTSTAVTFTIDTTPPAVSIDSVPSPTNNPTPTLEGKAGTEAGDEETVTVTIYDESTGGNEVAKESVAVTSGAWKYTPPHLEDGTYKAQAIQKDKAGNTGESAQVTFTIDTVSPTVSINPIKSPTNNATPELVGSAHTDADDEENVTVTISKEGSIVAEGKNVPVTGGTWSYTPPHLADGTYTAQATEKDEAGNTGSSVPVTFTIDTTLPEVSINPVASPTNNPTPKLEGSAHTDADDEENVTVTIHEGSSAGGKVVAEGKSVPVIGGTWSYTPPHLADGTYTAQATEKDEAGNKGTSEPPVTFTIDTTPPAVHLATPLDKETVHSSRPTFSGGAGNEAGDDENVTLRIYEGTSTSDKLAQEATIERSGDSWSTEANGPQLPNGVYTAQVTQLDDAGNKGRSTPHTFTVDKQAPKVTLNKLPELINDATPSFSGLADTAPEDKQSVTLKVYPGSSTSGKSLQSVTVSSQEGSWSTGPIKHLADGTYTAQAEQTDEFGHTGVSASTTFTVDTTPPHVTLSFPATNSSTTSNTQLVKGTAGTAAGDLPSVTVQLFSGASIGNQTPLESIVVGVSKGAWAATFGGLNPGEYTVRAEQSDEAGNLGVSTPSTFTVLEPPAPPSPGTPPAQSGVAASKVTLQPPHASFTWFPPNPHTGETISLASNSTDPDSPLTGYAWDLAGNGAFQAGGAVTTTSFATPGKHTVQLRVTDAAGLSSVVAETIEVTAPPLLLMQPFPVVRIAGSLTADGVRVQLLTVQAPAGARITVRCHGHGCPSKTMSRIAAARKGKRIAPLEFHRFERSLRAGTVLEVRVSKVGEIGKYTRFTIRRGRSPKRVDTCLDPAGVKPIACPSA